MGNERARKYLKGNFSWPQMFRTFSKNNNNKTLFKLNTVKSRTAAHFTGVYMHYDKTNASILEGKKDDYNVKYNK